MRIDCFLVLQSSNSLFFNCLGPTNSPVGALESDLDFQQAAALARDADLWFWTVDKWLLEFAQDLASHSAPPKVVSASWGWPSDMSCGDRDPGGNCGGLSSTQYVSRCETEFAKSSAREISLLAASGDQGAPGDGHSDCSAGLSDIYPGSSHYFLSVGATMLGENESSGSSVPAQRSSESEAWGAPICDRFKHIFTKCADGSMKNEIVCTHEKKSLITSGGGTSTMLMAPSWQQETVQNYFNSGVALPPASMFNRTTRAFPDVSALGNSYLVWMASSLSEPVSGTSASW